MADDNIVNFQDWRLVKELEGDPRRLFKAVLAVTAENTWNDRSVADELSEFQRAVIGMVINDHNLLGNYTMLTIVEEMPESLFELCLEIQKESLERG